MSARPVARAFAAAAMVLGIAAAAPAAAAPTEASIGAAKPDPAAAPLGASKKEQLIREKADARPVARAARARWHALLRRRMGKKPAELINVHNLWTREFVALDAARPGPVPAELVDRFLRCHFTNHRTAMDARLFAVLLKAAKHFKAARVDIVSGYRAAKYNLMLRKKGRRVARNSEHTFGHAVDFRLSGVKTKSLRTWARRLRLGGVGYYRADGFVHVDTGPVRYWAE